MDTHTIHKCMDGQTCTCMDRRTHLHRCMDGRTHTYTDAWTDGRTQIHCRWISKHTYTLIDTFVRTHTKMLTTTTFIYRVRDPTSKFYSLYHGTVSLLCNKKPSSFLCVLCIVFCTTTANSGKRKTVAGENLAKFRDLAGNALASWGINEHWWKENLLKCDELTFSSLIKYDHVL